MELYLDYNATTPIDSEVAEAMKPYLNQYFGNPSSMHHYGRETKKAIEYSREQTAKLIHCQPHEIIFTSGGTESNNYAIKGIALKNKHKGNHIITSQIEHPAVTEVCKYLETMGFEVTYLPVDKYGMIQLTDLKKSIKQKTILISIMHANNEIGTIQPIDGISRIAIENNILFHTDAAQSAGKIPVNVKENNIDLLSLAGHKLYAPKGVGALYLREGIKLEKLIHGADHEREMRAGTENVLEIVGFGKACEIAHRDMEMNRDNMQKTKDNLYFRLSDKLKEIKLNGHPEKRLPNTLSLSFKRIEANYIVNELNRVGIAVSAGAACHTEDIQVSPVLEAINLEKEYAIGTIRFSTGKNTSVYEIEQAGNIIVETIQKLQPDSNKLAQSGIKKQYKLTEFTQGMGCACKLRPQELEKILAKMSVPDDPNILIGTQNSDDAAVYKINSDTAIVQTLDFITPIVDDPYTFGAIAAANALSDIYAMGAKPIFALNIVGFPFSKLPVYILEEILRGATNIAKEAKINIIGGHTIDDLEPKFGLTVTGTVHPDKILSNGNAQPGDVLLLTKPLGTGILSTAVKRGLAGKKTIDDLQQVMTTLNNTAANVMNNFPVHSCTDVTGFGLLGHLKEIVNASNISAKIYMDKVPLLNETIKFAGARVIPGGTHNNLKYLENYLTWDNDIPEMKKLILCDAQTSGGLLIALPEKYKTKILNQLGERGIKQASCIGKFTEKNKQNIKIINS